MHVPERRSIVSTMLSSPDVPWQELDGNLRAFIARRVRNPADVDDLVQRVLLQIVQGLETLRETDRLHAWVYRVARNVIVDFYRAPSTRREVTTGDAEDAAAAVPMADAADERQALHELATCLDPLMQRLAPPYREAVMLTELDGITQADAAIRAGVSVSGMKSRVQRGRRQLKDVLEACCRIDLDRRGTIVGYARRTSGSCSDCGPCQ
jgi:RNA polymerase sigma-70 factor (ECF subfamily)